MLRVHSAWLALLLAVTLAACNGDTTTEPLSSASSESAIKLQNLSPSNIIECPPTVPPGYSTRFCFQFELLPGVLHGFLVAENNRQPPFFEGMQPGTDFDPDNFMSDYLLVSPTGFERISWRQFPFDATRSVHFFQTEYFLARWWDVLRISLSTNELAPQRVTLAVAERAITASLQTSAIVRQVETLLSAGSLNSGQASALLATLNEAIRLLETNDSASAANLLRAFLNQVSAFIAGRRPTLSTDEAAALTAAAEAVLLRLSSE